MNILIKRMASVLAGGILGFAYYYYIGCNSGSCPITSNPYISTLYGALFGFIIAFPTKKNNVQTNK
jgi:phosphotransferase system  glucose/maltose/N-acetylglucosamine-specific IIC component